MDVRFGCLGAREAGWGLVADKWRQDMRKRRSDVSD